MKKLIIAGWLCSSFLAARTQTGEQAATLRQGFETWRKHSFLEKTFLQTDKQNYLAGELIWWNFFCVDGSLHRPSGLSKVGYVELLDAGGNPVLQAKAALENGMGKGSFFLPVSLSTGSYELRAYTRWMRNNDDRYFFRQKITIINPFKAQQAPVSLAQSRYILTCRPEAGKLIAGIPARVGVLLEGPVGNTAASGWLLNEKGDSLQPVATDQYGLASFRFTPATDHQYKIVFTTPAGAVTATLPAAQAGGNSITAQALAAGAWQVQVQGDAAGKSLYLFLQNRQAIRLLQAVTGTTASLSLPATMLGEGVNQLSLVDAGGQVLASRLLYQPPLPLSMGIGGLATAYRQRQAVDLQATGLPAANGYYTISVTKETALDKTPSTAMRTWWWLGSDLGLGADLLNRLPAIDDIQAIDPLLLLAEGRPFAFGAPKTPLYAPEYGGQQLMVKLSDEATGRPVVATPVQLAITGGKPQFYLNTSDSNGLCRFDIHNFYGNGTLVFQVDKIVKSGYKFEPEYSFAPAPTVITQPATTALPVSLETDLSASSFALQVRNQYTADSINQFDLPVLDSLSFYGTAANSYMLDKYVRFTTVEEVLREYVTEVAVRLRNGKQQLLMIDQVGRGLYTSEPLILLDGIPCSSEQILAIDPLKLMRVDVVDRRYVFSEYLYDGVISFVTYNGNGLELLHLPNAGIFEMEGLQLERRFYTADHAGADKDSRIPDYRSLLYWQQTPAGKNGEARFSFFTGDVPGRYKVTVEGNDNQGRSSKTVQYFEITDK